MYSFHLKNKECSTLNLVILASLRYIIILTRKCCAEIYLFELDNIPHQTVELVCAKLHIEEYGSILVVIAININVARISVHNSAVIFQHKFTQLMRAAYIVRLPVQTLR